MKKSLKQPLNIKKSLQSMKKSLKNVLNCCKLQIVLLKIRADQVITYFKDGISKDFTSGVIYKFHCGLCNESCYGECVKTLEDKNLSISSCKHSTSYDDFSILMCESKTVLVELKKSQLIMRDKPSLNRNITLN